MLQIAFVRENQEKVIKALAKRNMDAQSLVEEVVQLDESRRSVQAEMDNALSESNKLSKSSIIEGVLGTIFFILNCHTV